MCLSVRLCRLSAACCFDATHCLRAPGTDSRVLVGSLHSCPHLLLCPFLSIPPADFANSHSVALIANLSEHVCKLYTAYI